VNLPSNHIPAWVDKARLAAEISGSVDTVERWVRQGLLPKGVNRGGKTLWKWKEVELWLEKGGPPEAGSELDAESMRQAMNRLSSKRG
jgi:hypothetical protein